MKLGEKGGGVVLGYAQMVLNVLVKFVYTPFLLMCLGQSEYGLFSLVMSVVGYMAVLDLGFGSTVTRYTVKYLSSNDEEGLKKLYGTISVVYIIIGIVAFFICVALSLSSSKLFGRTMTPEEVDKLRLMLFFVGINLLFTFPLQISRSVVIANEKFVFKNLVELIRVIIQPCVLVALLYFLHIKSVGSIVIVTSFNFLSFLTYYIYSYAKLNFKFSLKYFSPHLIPTLLAFSGWMFGMMIFEQVQFNMGQFILGMFQSSKVIAVWGIAMIFILNYRSLSTAITNVFIPSFLRMSFNSEKIEMTQSIVRMTRLQAIVLFTIFFNMLLFGKDFILLWAGYEYVDAYKCAITVMAPMTVALILDFCYFFQLAHKKMVYRTITFFGSFFLSFVLIYFFRIYFSIFYFFIFNFFCCINIAFLLFTK